MLTLLLSAQLFYAGTIAPHIYVSGGVAILGCNAILTETELQAVGECHEPLVTIYDQRHVVGPHNRVIIAYTGPRRQWAKDDPFGDDPFFDSFPQVAFIQTETLHTLHFAGGPYVTWIGFLVLDAPLESKDD